MTETRRLLSPGRRIGARMALAALLPVLLASTLLALDRLYPPNLEQAADLSRVLVDRDGRPLRYALASDDRLRLPVDLDQVDPKLLAMLVAYEDQRFWSHPGVDALALARALGQWLWYGRPVSGASTLSMQTARLLEPRPRTLFSKLLEMGRALQLERHLSKREILALYLRLAPYGGNLEGVLAASRYWFGHGPATLTPAEAALLVALPQSPTRLRPDRHPAAARAARAKVLERVWPRVAARLGLTGIDLALARDEVIALAAPDLPRRAPHLADRLFGAANTDGAGAADTTVRSCLDGDLQRRVEDIAQAALRSLHSRASVAVLVVNNRDAEARAYVGAADYLSEPRAGQVDLVTAIRSPGSTLKPLVYGLVFDTGLAAPATLVADAPTRFGGYLPANFEGRYRGVVDLAEALRLSLNVPAVALLDALGPARFTATLARHGVPLVLPDQTRPGLAIALGGAGSRLEDLVGLYRALADDGRVLPLRLRCDRRVAPAVVDLPLLGAAARWHVTRILREVAAPDERLLANNAGGTRRIAYKTGTSYGYRDAWSLGYDAEWTVGVWVGRADGTPLPGVHGRAVAAPILFRVFDELPRSTRPTIAPPPDALLAWDRATLPPGLRDLGRGTRDRGPRVLFPLPDTSVLMTGRAIPLEAGGGRPPYTWLIDGAPLATGVTSRGQWQPPGPGFVLATVLDADGRADRVRFRVTGMLAPDAGRLRATP